MITAQLKYNPYLRTTEILFNGEKPRINSLVEKYQEEILQKWISQVPAIFRDEMNGYGFALEFQGTKTDYEELVKAFERAGVTKQMVSVVHLKELADRKNKLELIDQLLDWLNENNNGNFDYAKFRKDNEELFEGSYPYIIINGRSLDTSMYENSDINVETIDVISELDSTDLKHTPIVLYLDRNSLPSLRSNLLYLKNRPDVDQDQLFFYIDQQLNRRKVYRLISDYGIVNPQIISSAADPKVRRYMELYPFTDYIAQTIDELNGAVFSISQKLEKANEESEKTNSEVHKEINELSDDISRIKTVIDIFDHKDNLQMPDEWQNARDSLFARIYGWNKKKVKITNPEEAAVEAVRFNEDLQEYYKNFCDEVLEGTKRASKSLSKELNNWYMQSGLTDEVNAASNKLIVKGTRRLEEITADLLKLKEEKFVEAKEDIMGLLFGQPSQKKLVKETTYYYQKWREYAADHAREAAEIFMENLTGTMTGYYESMAQTYLEKLKAELMIRVEKQNEISSQLSDDEKKLQADNSWLSEFKDLLKEIERG